MRGRGQISHRGAAVLAASLSLAALLAAAAVAGSIDEFARPSASQPPPRSRYNATPVCAPTAANGFDCAVPPSSLPPRDLSNPERYLNSAYWPAEKRPDIEKYAVERYGYSYKNCAALSPHYCFLVDAQAVGYPVSHTPATGDLWLAPCNDVIWMNGGACSGSSSWYLGYVERAYPDGSFLSSWGGSDSPADSGLAVSRMSGAMDAGADFVGFLPAGTTPSGTATAHGGTTDPALKITIRVGTRGVVPRRRASTWKSVAYVVRGHLSATATFVVRKNFAVVGEKTLHVSGAGRLVLTSLVPLSRLTPDVYTLTITIAGTSRTVGFTITP